MNSASVNILVHVTPVEYMSSIRIAGPEVSTCSLSVNNDKDLLPSNTAQSEYLPTYTPLVVLESSSCSISLQAFLSL